MKVSLKAATWVLSWALASSLENLGLADAAENFGGVHIQVRHELGFEAAHLGHRDVIHDSRWWRPR